MSHEDTRDVAPLHWAHEPRRIVVAHRRAQPELPAQATPPREYLAALRALPWMQGGHSKLLSLLNLDCHRIGSRYREGRDALRVRQARAHRP